MKSLWLILSLIYLVANGVNSLKEDEYTSAILKLSSDPTFVEEYKKWTSKLFSDPNYLQGKEPGQFPCQINSNETRNDPLTVHNLRPKDIQCVAAIGDSLTAALGAQANTPIGLVTEYRGVSWSVGGDQSYETLLTVPNILRVYNPNLKGYSTKTSVIFLKGQNSSHNGLNVAKSGATSLDMYDQAQILLRRFQVEEICNLQEHWKMITFFIGGNDLCAFAPNYGLHNPISFRSNIEKTLDFFHANIPRAFVNLVLVLDVRYVEKLNAGGFVCSALHKNTCPCAAFPSGNDTDTLNQWVPQYHAELVDLINSGKYDTRNNFTVVLQPFLAHTVLPMNGNEIDYSYFAPDCFHLSGKGHSRAALSLWNNLLEPVGQKQWSWHEGEQIECPTQDRPFFATRLNSPTPYEKIPNFI